MISRNPDRITLSETNLAVVETGLLSPTGVFHTCFWGEHYLLAVELGYPSAWDMVKHGWMRIAEGEFFDYTGNWEAHVPPPTKAQVEAIFDWVMAREGRVVPKWLDEIR